METSGNLKKIVFESDLVESGAEERFFSLHKINTDGAVEPTTYESPKGNKIKFGKWTRALLFLTLLFFVFCTVSGLLVFRFYKKGRLLEASVRKVVASVRERNLSQAKKELSATKQTLGEFENSYKTISYLRFVPFFGKYVEDVGHAIRASREGVEASFIFLEAVEPYASIIGFSTDGSQKNTGQTAQDRLDFVIQTIPSILPRADDLIEKIASIRKEIDYIDYQDYPEEFSGIKVREKIKELVEMVDATASLVENGKPLLQAVPYLMGVDKERRYLVLFQNDKELRPTGGFITAYSIASVYRGRFDPVSSSDIYNLDNLYKPRVKAADPVVKYLKGPYVLSKNFRLRDMNWSPDFRESMELFLKEAQTTGIGEVDGVIAVDTQLLVYLLDVIGPVSVPGYGNFSTKETPECRCPQVIYELESFADIEGPIVWSENEPGKIVYAPPNYDNRKKIIGPLMNSILSATLGQPEEKFPALFEVALKSLLEKHVLFYIKDGATQNALERFGIAGKIVDFDADYLHINDANLGGRKSNLYVIQEVDQDIKVDEDGTLTKTLTITYSNPEKHDGWLNSVLPNWVRVYVPKGSQLIEASGFEEKEETYEDLGKTVFAGFFRLRPQGVAKITLKYRLPFKVGKEYSLFIQKQPGTGFPRYSLKIGKKKEEFYLKTDKVLKISL